MGDTKFSTPVQKTVKCDIHWKAVEQYFIVVFLNFTQFVSLENLSILDLALSGVNGLSHERDLLKIYAAGEIHLKS